MNIYEFDNYKNFIRNWLTKQPKHGHGLFKKWAEDLRVSSTLMSQIFNGDKDFSSEMASDFCQLMGFSDNESDYFLLLVDFNRAGSAGLKRRLKKRIENEQKRAENLSQRIKVDKELDEKAKAIFYSNWLYSAIRNLSAIEKFQNVDQIAEHLQIPRAHVQEVIEFLIEHTLCDYKNGKLQVGPKRTHIAANSPLVSKHHQNWRLQGFQKMILRKPEDLFFTFPMSLSAFDAKKIRQYLPSIIEEIHKIVGPSESEVVRCLNIDFFEY